MKINTVNLNFNFNLNEGIPSQVEALEITLKLLAQKGIEVNSNGTIAKVASTGDRVNREMGANEALLLEKTGKSRMRITGGETDREAYAARLLKEKYGAFVGSAINAESDSTESEDEDEDDADLM